MKKALVGVLVVTGLALVGCGASENDAAPNTARAGTSSTPASYPTSPVIPAVWDRESIISKLQKASGEYEACKTLGTRECVIATSRGDQVVDSVRAGISNKPEWAPIMEVILEADSASNLLDRQCLSGLAAQESASDMNACTAALRTLSGLADEAEYRLNKTGFSN